MNYVHRLLLWALLTFTLCQSFAIRADGPPLPGGGGSTNNPPVTNIIETVVYGTNDFWLDILPYGTNFITQDTNSIALIIHSTAASVPYQILSKQSLTDAFWTVEQNLLGAANQNWTPTTVSITNRPTLFLKALDYSTLDSDSDGIPDWWEIKYGLNPYNPSDASVDPDGDGWTNLQEYQNGTNPNDPADLGLKVKIMRPRNNSIIP